MRKEEQTMIFCVNNETTATDFYFDMPEKLANHLMSTNEKTLAESFDPVGVMDPTEDDKMLAGVKKIAVDSGILTQEEADEQIKPYYMRAVFLETGWNV